MGHPNHCVVLLGVLLLFGPYLTSADKKCSLGCHGSQSVFKYVEGEVYKYNLKGSSISSIPGAKEDASSLSLDASVEVLAGPQCTFTLKVNQAVVTGADGKKFNLPKEVTEYPVQFSTSGTKLFNEICANDADTKVSLNIKRGIISHFQASVLKESGTAVFHETDFLGACSTNFRFNKEGNELSVQKTRDLNSCAYREDLNLAFLSTPYYVQSDVQASPLLYPTYESDQKFEDGILKVSEISETYIYRPLAAPESGAKVNVNSKLVLTSHAKGSLSDGGAKVPKSLIFEAAHDKGGAASVDTLIKSIQAVVEKVEPTVLFDGANKFNDFVGIVKQAKKEDLTKAWSILKSGGGVKSPQTAKSVFLDALFRAGTGDSISVAVDLLKSKEIPKDEADLWYLSFGFSKHVDQSALASVATIFDNDASWQVYLGAGSLANRYFREHSVQNKPEFENLLRKLAEPLKGGCVPESYTNEDKIIASLKGLANVKHLTPEVSELVGACFSDSKVKTRIRSAALDTFQTDAGKPNLKAQAIKLLQDIDEDSELRIKAYLGLVQCVCAKTAQAIKDLLDKEPSRQVGRFITSHLRNLKSTVNPSKEAAKFLYGAIPLPSKYKYPQDLRKYSSNYEFSYIFDSLNMGASGEANVIFSPKSFVPRTVSLNLTTHVFGQAFNVFEVDLRAQNLEYILEHYMGQRGAYSDDKEVAANLTRSVDKMYDSLKARYQRLVNRKERAAVFNEDDLTGEQSSGRNARSAEKVINENKMDAASEEANLERGKRSTDTDAFFKKATLPSFEEPNLDIYVKILGSGIAWSHRKDKDIAHEIQIDYADNIKPGEKVDFKKHFTFLDAELLYPTSLGFTLRLNAVGSSAVNLKSDITGQSNNNEFSLHVSPSAAVELVGILSVDSYATESGLKLTSTLHSSTGTDITYKTAGKSGFELKVGLPVQKQDIVNFKTEITSVVKEPGLAYVETPIKFNVKRAEHGGCFDQLVPIIGLTPCAVVSFPFDGQKFLNPIYGPSKVALNIEKEKGLDKYLLKAVYDENDKNVRSFEFLLDTPGSKTDRKLQFVGEIKNSAEKKELKASLTTPLKSVELEGSFVHSATETGLHGKFLNDGVEHSINVGAHTSSSGSHRSYKPFLEYKIPNYYSDQKLISKKGGKNKGQQSVAVEGEIILDELPRSDDTHKHNHQYTFKNLAIITPGNKYELNGNVKSDLKVGNTISQNFDADLVLSYDYGKQTVAFKNKYTFGGDQRSKNFKLNLYSEVKPSQYPDFGVAIEKREEMSYEKDDKGQYNSKWKQAYKLTHGANLQSEQSRLSFENNGAFKGNLKSHDYEFNTDINSAYPLLGFDAKTNANILWKKGAGKSINVDVSGKYNKASFLSKLDAKADQKKSGDYDFTFKNKFLSNSIDLEMKRVIVSDEKEKFSNTLDFVSDSTKAGLGKYTLNAELTNSKKSDNTNRRIQAQLSVPQEDKPLKLDAGYKQAPSELKTYIDVTLGDNPYLSTSSQLVLSKTSPSGSFKFDLSDLLKTKASFKYERAKELTHDFTIQLLAPKVQRTVQGKTQISIDSDHYKGFMELLLDAEKDSSKKIRLDTDTLLKIDQNTREFATNSEFTLLTYVTKFKADAKVEGLLRNGKHSWSFDLTFPNESLLKGSYKGESNLKNPESDYKFQLDLSRDGKSSESIAKLPKKLSLNVKVDKIDPAKATFNSDVDFKLDGESEQLVDVVANVHSLENGDKRKCGYEHKAKGSVVPANHVKYSTEQSTEYYNGKFSFAEKKSFPLYQTKLEFGLTSVGEGSFEVGLNGKKVSYAVSGKLDDNYAEAHPGSAIKEFRFNSDSTFDISTPKSVFDSDNSLKWNKEKFIRVNFGVQGKEKGFSANGEVETHSLPKRTFTGALTADLPKDAGGKLDGSLNVKWEKNEAGLAFKGEAFKDRTGGKLTVIATHPKTGKVEISGSNKILKDNKGVNAELTFIQNEKKVKLGLKTDLTKNKEEFDFTVDNNGDITRVFAKLDKKDENRYAAAIKLQWVPNGGGSFEADVDVETKSVDDFLFKANIDSAKLDLKKVKLEISNKPSKGEAQKIQYTVKTEGKVIIAGSSTYIVKTEGDKQIVEGTGSFKFEDKSYPITFKYVKKTLRTESDGETGQLIKFNLNIEELKIKIEGENKFTDKTFRIHRNYCKDHKCYVNDLTYVLKSTDLLNYEQKLNIQVDLRPLSQNTNLPETHPFTLTAATTRDGLALNQELEIIWSETDKIQYKVYLESTQAGVSVILPKRTLAFQSTYDLKKEKGFLGEAQLWLDKTNAPEQKTSLLVKYDNSYDKNQKTVAASGEVRFSYPSLPKDMSVSGRAELLKDWSNIVDANLDIDTFQKKNQKIVVDLQIVREKRETGQKLNTKFSVISKEQNLNFILTGHTLVENDKFEDHTVISYTDRNNKKRDGLIQFERNNKKFTIKVSLFELFQWKGSEELKFNHKDNYIEYTSKHDINGNKFGEHLVVTKKGVFEDIYKWKLRDKSEREFGIRGEFNYQTKAEVQLSTLKDGKKVEVAVASVKFDQENFLKTSEAASIDDIKDLVVQLKEDFRTVVKDYSEVAAKIGKELTEESNYHTEELNKARPNLNPALTAINSQLKDLKEEISNDKTLKNVADHLKQTLQEVLDTFVTLLDAFANVVESVTTVSFDLADKLIQTIRSVTPAVLDAYTKISKHVLDAFDSVLKIGTQAINSFLDELKKHEADFKGLTNFGNDLFLGVGKVVAKWYAQARKEASEFYRVLSEQIQSLPIYSVIKDKLEELKSLQVPENVLSVVLELLEGIKESLPTPELKSFTESLISYLKKVVQSDQKLNFDSEELKTLFNKLAEALKSLLTFLPAFKASANKGESLKPSFFVPLPTFALFKYPLKLGSVHVSTFNEILNGEIANKVVETSYTTVRALLKPEELVPPFAATGLVVDRSYVFTYNGKWLPLAGSCSYVLAQDLKNNNLTVSIKVQNGKLTSVIVNDKTDEVEVSLDKKIKLNGAAAEYPVRSDNVDAWRMYGKIAIGGRSGVLVECSDTFDLCKVSVDGYYQNKVHGLLGSHNLEPYLDFTLPNGKRTEDKSEFYNSYAVGVCSSPAKISEVADKSPECKDIFSSNSSLITGYMFVNMQPYVDACNNEVAKLSTPEQKYEKACLFASAFSLAAHSEGGVWVKPPMICHKYAKCPNDISQEPLVLFNPPYSKADIVLVVEEDAQNQDGFDDLVVPLVPQLTADLKKIGFSDVHFSLIGYGSSPWPQHYTQDGEFKFDPQSSKINFADLPATEGFSFAEAKTPGDRLKALLRMFDLLGNVELTDALQQASYYPFRPDAARGIVVVSSSLPTKNIFDSLSVSFPLSLAKLFGAKVLYVGPIDAKVKTGPLADTLANNDIIGINKDKAYLLTECKSGSIVGNEQVGKQMFVNPAKNFLADVFRFTGGAFNSEAFISADAEERKAFTKAVSSVVAENLSVQTQQTCACYKPLDKPARYVCAANTGLLNTLRLSAKV